MPTVIDRFEGEYRFLSNFWESPLIYESRGYPTVEHAFQASKTYIEDMKERIRLAPTPAAAKRYGKGALLRKDWDIVKVPIMKQLLQQKFLIPELREKLLATGDAELIEGNWWNDRFWGVCMGTGQNCLGKLLMEVRDELKGSPVSEVRAEDP